MKSKIQKLVSVYKKYGLNRTITKTISYLNANFFIKYNPYLFIITLLKYNEIKSSIDDVFKGDYERIILWRGNFGFDIPLFQRPQHMAVSFSNHKCLVIYEVTTMTDDVMDIKKHNENLLLVNFNNILVNRYIKKQIKGSSRPKYLDVYSTNWNMPLKMMVNYINQGFKVIYEYIDDLNPKIIGTNEVPVNVLKKHNYALNNYNSVYVVCTADMLLKEVIAIRGKQNVTLATNGVDYDFFQDYSQPVKLDERFSRLIASNNPIIGYYGALASWVDYDLIKQLAISNPTYNIVLIGIKYDDSFDKANLSNIPNIIYLDAKPYQELKYYAKYFDVCILPFIINDITNATNPIKIFEYMALGKPVVSTNLPECRKYKSVKIANDYKEFIDLSRNMVKKQTKEYYHLLDQDALNNTWNSKARNIINKIKEGEIHD